MYVSKCVGLYILITIIGSAQGKFFEKWGKILRMEHRWHYTLGKIKKWGGGVFTIFIFGSRSTHGVIPDVNTYTLCNW